jgi:large subunit ribosomal protein L28
MSQVCELTGKRPAYGNKVSHSNIKTRTRWLPNLKSKKYLVPELGQTISLLLSTRAIRTIDKFGSITTAIMNAKESELSERVARVRRAIAKARNQASNAAKSAAPASEAKEAKAAAPKAKKAGAAKAKAKKAPAKKAAKK